MTKIRQLKPTDMKKIRAMIEYIKPGISSLRLSEKYFVMFPLDIVHGMFPLNVKFLQESYVAFQDKEILGVISILPENKKKTRWQINRLILNINSYDVGKQLIDYVVNKYGGAGVETFITTVNENYPEAIALFKNSCGFRSCSQVQMYEIEPSLIKVNSSDFRFIRKLKYSDAKYLSELDQEALFPHFRPSLMKSTADFKFGIKSKILNLLRNYKVKRFVLSSPGSKFIDGYFVITTKDNESFWLDITLSLAHQDYYNDILSYVAQYIQQKNKDAKLFVSLRKYYQSSKKYCEILNEMKLKPCNTYHILVKDYWKLTPAEIDKKVPIIIFPDTTSPA